MNNLNSIRQAFDPYIPIRWEVKFSNDSLNIISGTFSAKEVKFIGLKYKTVTITIAPGVDMEVNVISIPPTDITIDFYENSKRAIYKAIQEINKSLNTGVGGVGSDLTLTINEFDNKLSTVRTGVYKVQISGDYMTNLTQSVAAYEAPLKCNIVGIDQEL